MEIETERLLIREFEETDWIAVHEYACQAEILIFEPWGPNSEEETKNFVAHAVKSSQEEPRKLYEFAITLRSSGELIGGCGLKYLANKENSLNLGYIINPKFWNQGFATDAANALINFANQNLRNVTITATCDEDNLQSIRVLEKCGMKKIRTSPLTLKTKNRRSKTFHFEYPTI